MIWASFSYKRFSYKTKRVQKQHEYDIALEFLSYWRMLFF